MQMVQNGHIDVMLSLCRAKVRQAERDRERVQMQNHSKSLHLFQLPFQTPIRFVSLHNTQCVLHTPKSFTQHFGSMKAVNVFHINYACI